MEIRKFLPLLLSGSVMFFNGGFAPSYGQPCPVQTVDFSPKTQRLCGFPASVNFEAIISVDSTPIFQDRSVSVPEFQSGFGFSFPTAVNSCYFALKISGFYSVWSNPTQLIDPVYRFHPVTGDSLNQLMPEGLTIKTPDFVLPKTYNPNHEYWFFYKADGSNITVDFKDGGRYDDNSGNMTFEWYAVPCFDTIWEIENQKLASGQQMSYVFSQPGQYPVNLIVTELHSGCSKQISGNIAVFKLPEATVAVTETCPGEANGTAEVSVLAGQSPFQYQWSGSSADSRFQQDLGAGNYAVTVVDANGCQTAAPFSIREKAPLDVQTENLPAKCFGEATGSIRVLTTAPDFSYGLDNQPFQGTPLFENLPPGKYEVKVEDANGCLFSTSIIIEEPTPVTLDLAPEFSFLKGDSVELTANAGGGLGSYVYEWSPATALSCADCPNPIARPETETTYSLTVTDKNGCRQSAQTIVKLRSLGERNIYFPTAFSPNDDGINDIFTIYAGTDVTKIKAFKVFDRWGSLLFDNDSLMPNLDEDGWDGGWRGKKMPVGIYTWFAEVEWLDGEAVMYEGEVLLVR